MKTKSREINVFSVSALDLFASALGAFIVMSMIFMVFFTMTSQASDRVEVLQSELDACEDALAQCQGQLAHSVDAAALEQCQSDLASAESRDSELQSALGEAEDALARCQGQLAHSVDAAALEQCQSDLASAESRNSELQSAHEAAEARAASAGAATEQLDAANAELESCRRALKKTFVLVLASWSTSNDDVDLHVVDPQGNEFYFSDRRHPGSDAAFEEDNIRGPGNEIWLHPNAAPGSYRICYKLYRDSVESPFPNVRGSILWQEGKIEMPMVRLSDDEVRLAAKFEVDADGNVSLDRSGSGRSLGTAGCR